MFRALRVSSDSVNQPSLETAVYQNALLEVRVPFFVLTARMTYYPKREHTTLSPMPVFG